MAMPKSLSSYEDVRNYLERAIDAERGVRLRTGTRGEAVQLRQKLYTCRAKIREENKSIYPPGHPNHGTSPYDALILFLQEIGEVWFVEIRKGQMVEVEEL